MPPIRQKDFVMPLAAFTMAIVLGSSPPSVPHPLLSTSFAFPHLNQASSSPTFTDFLIAFYARSSINHARDNAANERGKNYERVLHERRALGMDGDVWEDRLRRKAEREAVVSAPVKLAAVGAASKGETT